MLSLTTLLMSVSVFIMVSTIRENSKLNSVQFGNGISSDNKAAGDRGNNLSLDEDNEADEMGSDNESEAGQDSGENVRPGEGKEQGEVENDSVPAAGVSNIVVVDAGHGGYDVGSIGQNGSREANNTLPVALKLGGILEKKGIEVIYTRKSDRVSWPSSVKSDLLARAEISNRAEADLFISIHNNSSEYKDIRGTETYYSSGSTKGERLASLVQSRIVKKVGTVDRGIKIQDFKVLTDVNAPSILVELGYISNTNEEYILGKPTYQQKFAEAIAEAIVKYLSENYKP